MAFRVHFFFLMASVGLRPPEVQVLPLFPPPPCALRLPLNLPPGFFSTGRGGYVRRVITPNTHLFPARLTPQLCQPMSPLHAFSSIRAVYLFCHYRSDDCLDLFPRGLFFILLCVLFHEVCKCRSNPLAHCTVPIDPLGVRTHLL